MVGPESHFNALSVSWLHHEPQDPLLDVSHLTGHFQVQAVLVGQKRLVHTALRHALDNGIGPHRQQFLGPEKGRASKTKLYGP